MKAYSNNLKIVSRLALIIILFVCLFANRPSLGSASAARGVIDDRGQISVAPFAEGFVIRSEDGQAACRAATPAEARSMMRRAPDQQLRAISPAALDLQQPQTGLKIVLRGTTQLDGFPAAKNAFIKAAQTWEALIKTPITIVIDVDYGPTQFGQPYEPNTIGSTQAQILVGNTNYQAVREALRARASSTQENVLYNSLPNTTVPTDIGSTAGVSAPSPLFRALGFISPTANPDAEQPQYGPPPSIGFNSAIGFDFDPANGIDANKVDFDSLAFHEIGHVLGFASAAGAKELDPNAQLVVTLWDLFRFRPGVTAPTFATAQRILSSGGDQVFFDGGSELAFSTARPDTTGGDGRQASHWKDDSLTGRYIGVMDPELKLGDRNLITANDLRAADAIGYQLRTSFTEQTAEMKVDDGTTEGGLRNDGLIIVNRLTPSTYPATLQNIRIQFRTFAGQPDPTGKPITLVYFTDASGSGQPPNSPQITRIETTVPGTSATTFFDLPITNGPTITSGDFYVGFQSPTPNQGVGHPLDTNGQLQSRSFFSVGSGMSFFPIGHPPGTSSANAMIRAVVSVTTSAPSIEITPSSLDFASINVNASIDRLLTVRNPGTAILNVTGIASNNAQFGVVAVSNSFVVAPGGQEAVTVRFSPTAMGSQTATLSIASNDPARATVNVQLSGTATTGQSFEADVAPRPNGNGAVTIADWTQAGRFVSGVDSISAGSEYQRADCAPREPRGNGSLSVADWVQAGRYAAGLDPAVAPGGPTGPASTSSNATTSAPTQSRAVRLANASLERGRNGSVTFELVAQGNENAVGFSVNFDPTQLQFVSAALGSDVSTAMLQFNPNQAANGRIGLALALQTGQSIAAGVKNIVVVNFAVAASGSATTTTIRFGDQPVVREIVDANANVLTTTFADATVTLTRAVANVSAASFTGATLASETIIAAFGQNLATRLEVATSQPLPTTLAGTTVKVRDANGVERNAPLFFVSPAQVNYLIPPGTANGNATVTITSGDGSISTGAVSIAAVAPGLFSANANGQGVAAAIAVRVKADGTQSFESIARFDAAQNRFVPIPIDLGPEGEQVFLILFGTGLRARSSLSAVSVRLGGADSEVSFAGPQGGFAGLDQINARIPRSLAGRGEIDLVLVVDGRTANTVRVTIK